MNSANELLQAQLINQTASDKHLTSQEKIPLDDGVILPYYSILSPELDVFANNTCSISDIVIIIQVVQVSPYYISHPQMIMSQSLINNTPLHQVILPYNIFTPHMTIMQLLVMIIVVSYCTI